MSNMIPVQIPETHYLDVSTYRINHTHYDKIFDDIIMFINQMKSEIVELKKDKIKFEESI